MTCGTVSTNDGGVTACVNRRSFRRELTASYLMVSFFCPVRVPVPPHAPIALLFCSGCLLRECRVLRLVVLKGRCTQAATVLSRAVRESASAVLGRVLLSLR